MALPILQGKQVRLRALKRSDADSIQRYADDPEVAEFLPMLPSPYSFEDARLWINQAHREAREKTGYSFGITRRTDDEVMGMMSLKTVNWTDRNAEIGYWLARDFWGKGYASEALRLILDFVFDHLRLVRAYAVVQEQNLPSIRILEKAGFVREGVWRRASRLGGRWHDVFAYGILKEDRKF
jgi:RimJ/RimL family protein N-acetyltransferase